MDKALSIIVLIAVFSFSILGFLALTHGTHTLIGCIASPVVDCPSAIMASAIHLIQFLKSFSLAIIGIVLALVILVFRRVFVNDCIEGGDFKFTSRLFLTAACDNKIRSWLVFHIVSPTG